MVIVLYLMSKSRIPLAQGTLSQAHTLRIIGGRRPERRYIKSAVVRADGLLLLRFERGSL
ncbi:hypothetical protein E5D57_011233 [Metarhizium anisopliae]|nr:hypothetical protein E5D57_011233 [Metarhizium anisopliae]